MICEKCGHQNIDENAICNNCGTPMKKDEDKNIVPVFKLQKGKHIDIEDIQEEKEQPSFSQTKRKVRNFLLLLLLFVIIGAIFSLGGMLLNSFSQKIINQYDDIMEHSSLALIYLGYDKKIDEKCSYYAQNYGFDYLNIEANKMSLSRKKKLRKELNIYNLTSTLVIVQDGVPIAYYSKISSLEDTLEFLQKNYLVPSIIGDTKPSLSIFDELTVSKEEAIIYLPTSYSDDTDDKSEIIKDICEENGLQYGEVKGYLLSLKQLKNIMFRIGFSEVQQDLILYVDDGKIADIIDVAKVQKNEYFHLFLNRGIINVASGDVLIKISQSKFLKLIKEKELNVVFVGSKNCLYCDRVRPILGKIATQNKIDIYYLEVTDNKERISNAIKKLGYEDGLTTTPFILFVENNKYVDSIIGLADKELYITKFVEYGFIK